METLSGQTDWSGGSPTSGGSLAGDHRAPNSPPGFDPNWPPGLVVFQGSATPPGGGASHPKRRSRSRSTYPRRVDGDTSSKARCRARNCYCNRAAFWEYSLPVVVPRAGAGLGRGNASPRRARQAPVSGSVRLALGVWPRPGVGGALAVLSVLTMDLSVLTPPSKSTVSCAMALLM